MPHTGMQISVKKPAAFPESNFIFQCNHMACSSSYLNTIFSPEAVLLQTRGYLNPYHRCEMIINTQPALCIYKKDPRNTSTWKNAVMTLYGWQ